MIKDILKLLPTGFTLFHIKYTNVYLKSVDEDYAIVSAVDMHGVRKDVTVAFDEKGDTKELYPERYQRNWKKLIPPQKDLPTDTPVMCCKPYSGWTLRYYAYNSQCFISGHTSKVCHDVEYWEHIVPVYLFDFSNCEIPIGEDYGTKGKRK